MTIMSAASLFTLSAGTNFPFALTSQGRIANHITSNWYLVPNEQSYFAEFGALVLVPQVPGGGFAQSIAALTSSTVFTGGPFYLLDITEAATPSSQYSVVSTTPFPSQQSGAVL